LAVRTRLFCQTIPPPPPNVNVDDAVPATATSVCKVDRYAAHAQGGCASCHGLMDPVGFGLENYDQLGRYRTVEADHPECTILGRGELKGIGASHGPAELEDRMLAARLVDGCLVQNVYRFAAGRTNLDDADLAVVQKLSDAMGQGDFRFEDVLL